MSITKRFHSLSATIAMAASVAVAPVACGLLVWPTATPADLLQHLSTTVDQKPEIVLRDSDAGRRVSVPKGTVIAIELAKSTSAPRWGTPAFATPGILVTIGYDNPHRGAFAALLRAVGNGNTEVVVATECDRVGEMCSGWTDIIGVTG